MSEDMERLDKLATLLAELRIAKEQANGALARKYAITITELEKVYAYFKTYVVEA